MGSFNGTCAISNLPIRGRENVTIFLLLENKNKKEFCYSNALYDLCPIPFYGHYNDYGSVEGCSGFGLPIVLNELKTQLYEFGQGANQYHDTKVNRDNFDVEKLFEAAHEGRLGIQDLYAYDMDARSQQDLERIRDDGGPGALSKSQQFELDRLAAKIRKVDTFRAVTFAMIRDDVLDRIKEKWYIEEYLGAGLGNQGDDNSYIHIYFKDLMASIPEYIGHCNALSASDKLSVDAFPRIHRLLGSSEDWDSSNLAIKWLTICDRGHGGIGLVNVRELINEYIDHDDWDGLEKFVTETLTGIWINSYMSHINRLWSKQMSGGQDIIPHGFLLLTDVIKDVLEEYSKEYEE